MAEQCLLSLAAAVATGLVGAALITAVRRITASPRSGGVGGVQQRRLDGGLRVLTGDQPGLSTRWTHGRVVVEPGRITVRPFRWGVRLLPMPTVAVPVVAVIASAPQHSGWRSAFAVAPGLRLVPLRTATGALVQLAVLPASAAEVMQTLAPELP